MSRTSNHWMTLALAEASRAALAGEVPVGAVVVQHGKVIATGRNAPVQTHDPTAHAEMVALRAAAQAIGNYRLDDCELYVTLEPCAMCSGAMLHARLKRVVFGAFDPKTGAAGSVINLFAQAQLNHQTTLQGGIMAADSAALLQGFFRQRRADQRQEAQRKHPLRDDALRTPDKAFNHLPDYPWPPHYINDLPTLAGLRLHYLDVVTASTPGTTPNTPLTYFCLHSHPTWSYLYRHMIPVFLQAGHRVIAPDLIGFGKSDKPKKTSFHKLQTHRQIVRELIERLDLKNIVLVVQRWDDLIGLMLPMHAPQRYHSVLALNTLQAAGDTPPPMGCAADNAPFPDVGHRAAPRAFQALLPEAPSADGTAVLRQALDFWQHAAGGQRLLAVGAQDEMSTALAKDGHTRLFLALANATKTL